MNPDPIATPQGVAHFSNAKLSFGPPAEKPDIPADAAEALWATYFSNIFNPARLHVKAMKSEMPVKYWRNLPEARLICRSGTHRPACAGRFLRQPQRFHPHSDPQSA
ncbi:DUF4130 domain-containing protein [Paracoccus sp. S1E-3]|uniref:DUF4130 domain-containing protein n=1 Tax=Paracoccus sp. S1E-3 TaxID=2756130 RepID=UPI00351AE6CF